MIEGEETNAIKREKTMHKMFQMVLDFRCLMDVLAGNQEDVLS